MQCEEGMEGVTTSEWVVVAVYEVDELSKIFGGEV
jgi:hypothetical protein